MKDTLLEQRKKFSERLQEASKMHNHESRDQRDKRTEQLLNSEIMAEFAYRSGLTRGKIIGLGLEESISEIIDGMNQGVSSTQSIKISHPYSIRESHSYSIKECQKFIRAESDALLKFAFNYVDKWIMYNNLFDENYFQSLTNS